MRSRDLRPLLTTAVLGAGNVCSGAVGPISNLLSRIGVQPAERSLFGWGVLCLFCVGAATSALLNTAEALFLKRVGVEAMPMVLLVNSVLLVLTTGAIGGVADESTRCARCRRLNQASSFSMVASRFGSSTGFVS
jgi:hypothetical protein